LHLSGGPWYVVSKDANKNIVYVSNDYYDDKKKRNKLRVTDIHWISGEDPGLTSFDIKLRHGPVFYKCSFKQVGDVADLILLDAQDQGISAGQFVVFYDQSVCLGSAMIIEDLNNSSKMILI
jgi:tRNA-specific 2-thiouridylase